jgi:primase-polymerase (primpol)-like protein
LPSALGPLIAQPRWVLWRWKPDKKGKPTKPPYKAAAPSEYASSTDPETWSDFTTAVAAERHADGIGYCLLNSDI